MFALSVFLVIFDEYRHALRGEIAKYTLLFAAKWAGDKEEEETQGETENTSRLLT